MLVELRTPVSSPENEGTLNALHGPFTQVFRDYTNPERKHIHVLIRRWYYLCTKPQTNKYERKEIKALVWVLSELEDLEGLELEGG